MSVVILYHSASLPFVMGLASDIDHVELHAQERLRV